MGDRRLPGTACSAELSYSVLSRHSISSWMRRQGLGEELALVFAAHGARLILSARNTERLQVLCFPVQIHDDTACFWTAKASDSQSCFPRLQAATSLSRATEAFVWLKVYFTACSQTDRIFLC